MVDSSDLSKLIGGVMRLSQYSAIHLHYTVAQWQRRILPSINLNQYRYYEDEDGRPIAFCNWALVSSEVRNALLAGERDLVVSDWASGDTIFITELIAPFGNVRAVLHDLRRHVFSDRQGQVGYAVQGVTHAGQGYFTQKVRWFTV
ncbi:toxin-activating lysine-acyltransferase [Chromobacterium violaceum]|uniref:toxin-activating lysine-acyltransferase n=1 Tax=Chromobacterium violaceum TaxID=536 RepID=UPI001B329745|nr:toxin-activating lysine-acyltransferase [Chromobacterium violaceum]MBP4048402.1 toxin-activating lysine-acyltransferase [Chromobacterium violaceum]